MNRRIFLSHSLASAAGVLVLPSLLPGCTSVHDPLHDYGLITNVVQNLMKEDHRGTMTLLAEMGYKYLEFGGTFDENSSELKQFMDGCLEMGKPYLVCYWPWVNWEEHPSYEGF